MVEEILVQILDHLKTYFTNPLFLVPIVWIGFGGIVCWLIISAKKHQPISVKDVNMLWKSHKQFNQCKAKKFEKLTKGKKIIGFKCQCGYEHKQKRPIINFRI
jgi:hypothetical protein